MRKVLFCLSVIVLVGCGKGAQTNTSALNSASAETVVESARVEETTTEPEETLEDISSDFDGVIVDLCKEFMADDYMKVLHEIKNMLTELAVEPTFELFNGHIDGEVGTLYFDMLNNDDHILHITAVMKDGKCVVDKSYDTPEEWKEDIMDSMKEIVGPDADIKIADRYFDFVEVRARGDVYQYKDGVLARVDE